MAAEELRFVGWACLPCGWGPILLLVDEMPPPCQFCKRCLSPVWDQDGVDILET